MMTRKAMTGQNNILFLALFFMALLAFGFLNTKTAQALPLTTSTVRGSALWGSNGYLYFSCLDYVTGDRFDDPYNLCGGINGSILVCGTIPNVFRFYVAPCSGSSHQVYISNTGNFSGSAWNYFRGYVTFDATSTAPLADYSFNVNCSNPCNASNNCLACYNENTQKVYGWARVIDDNSWINLQPATTSPTVQIKSWNAASSTSPFYSDLNLKPGDFIGFATSTNADLSFNCLSANEGSSCDTYKVYISSLALGNLSAPNWTAYQACAGSARGADLRWYQRSGQQTAYEVVVSKINTFSTSTAVCWSKKQYLSINKFTLPTVIPSAMPTCATLEYNQKYYWWIRLFDENDQPTIWYQYDSNSVADTDMNSDGNVSTFSTYKHEFPNPYFTWTPVDILVSATTTFTNISSYYTDAGPITPQPNCVGPSCLSTWTTTDPGAIITAPLHPPGPASTSIFFLQATGTTITLKVQDSESYICSTSTTRTIQYGLPIWREVKAE